MNIISLNIIIFILFNYFFNYFYVSLAYNIQIHERSQEVFIIFIHLIMLLNKIDLYKNQRRILKNTGIWCYKLHRKGMTQRHFHRLRLKLYLLPNKMYILVARLLNFGWSMAMLNYLSIINLETNNFSSTKSYRFDKIDNQHTTQRI